MRITRSWAVALLTALSILGLASPALAAPTAAGRYVALGDSYSSGLGAGSYGSSGNCKRSSNSYAQLWANAHAPSSFAFVACSGAVTSDVTNNQLSALTSTTALVTISVGGNDAGFANVMTDCNLGSDSACVAGNNAAQNFARTTLPGRLNTVYSQIRTRAPSARVVVMGYPRIYKLGGSCAIGLSETKRAAINQSSDVLASVISSAASAHGFTFVDGRNAFAGHEICASGTRWINSVSLPIAESYHPNSAGQNGGYYAALRAVTG
ncbi:SGNH/GDSL hydrolase family protein [Actinokineospora spheciospongiae]|uniref:SGNH/GDSL hydrolase family protein n=1 Tax=Actinokineospora spheciospongiae TaxID=909613 RepID=UPI000D7192CC|nr:SGNH/GDSL hydrolase family protein [Actinokineospora spheciospongiae]PWW64658.1 GDSL-like lipase/acylhydrolase family protein [Actinokineospora spheciospongiae]